MTMFEAVSVIFGSLGLLGGAIGFLRALAAERRSSIAEAVAADAQADAAAALAKSAEATERIAAALELIAGRRGATAGALRAESPSAELESLLGRPEVRWALERRTVADSYRLRNVGSLVALDVTIGGHPERASLQPGAALTFFTRDSSSPIDLTWHDDSDAEQRLALALPPR